MSLAYDLFVNGGPVAFGVGILYIKQAKMERALIRMAGSTEGVDEDRIAEDLKVF